MNKSDLKNFAIRARLELLQRVADRAALYGVDEAKSKTRTIASSETFHKLDGAVLTDTEIRQRNALIARVYRLGYRPAMEEAAYTWFNRFIAIKYMQEHQLLPVLQRVLPDSPSVLPQVLREAQDVSLPGVDPAAVLALLDANRTDELYKLLLIALCNALSDPLPGMFEKISQTSELLFPDALLKAESVLGELAKLDADSWSDIQVIGWLYQYYISQRHDEVVDINGSAIPKADIPAATCLYTTDWVVRYMVENSLGRLWLEGHPDQSLRMKWRYYMDETPQEPEVAAQLADLRRGYAVLQPEQLTVLDPCMGSGHILVYAFDVLMDIYRSVGYTDRDAVQSIMENNLYGLDIDDRAAQLAYFALMMKACEYDRRFLRRGVQPHVCAIAESVPVDEHLLDVFGTEKPLARQLVHTFANAKEYGSLLSVDLTQEELRRLSSRVDELESSSQNSLLAMADSAQAVAVVKPLLHQSQILAHKYDAVITNPPYMNKFSNDLKRFVQENYADFKADLFAAFMHRNFDFCKENGYSAFMTPFVWMFIKSYEKLREEIIRKKCITTLIQLEYSAFEEATVPICTFVLRNFALNYKGNYLRLSDFKGGMDVQNEMVLKAQEEPSCGYRYTAQQDNFSKIPGAPVAYWVGERFLQSFVTGIMLGKIADSKQGLATSDNDKFVRFWYEPSFCKLTLHAHDATEAVKLNAKWVPYNKGGNFRKWYGNNEFVVNWENNGYEIKHLYDKNGKLRSRPQNTQYYFRESGSWSLISSSVAAFRYKPYGHIFDVAGMSFFSDDNLYFLLGLCNSVYTMQVLAIVAPTINYQCGDIANIPVKLVLKENVEKKVSDNILLSRNDWDSFETSWDFKKHPMI